MVRINGTYSVQVEDKCLTLQKEVGTDNRTGKPKYTTVGYYSSWEAVFDRLIKIFVAEKVNLETVVTLSQLKDVLLDTKKEVRALLTDFL